MEQYTQILNYASAVCAFFAAVFWFWSAIARAKPTEPESDESGFFPASITVNNGDLAKTLKKQSMLSGIAALFAGLSAILQAVGISIRSFW
jgi:hypothetical protein